MLICTSVFCCYIISLFQVSLIPVCFILRRNKGNGWLYCFEWHISLLVEGLSTAQTVLSSFDILFNNIFTGAPTYCTVHHIYTKCTWQQIGYTLVTLWKYENSMSEWHLNVNIDFQLTPEHYKSSSQNTS